MFLTSQSDKARSENQNPAGRRSNPSTLRWIPTQVMEMSRSPLCHPDFALKFSRRYDSFRWKLSH